MTSFDEYLRASVRVLRSGGLVALPTETVYGLAALVSIPRACARIFDVKQRPHFDPLIMHVGSLNMLESFVALTPGQHQRLEKLSARFWPGPLTLILPKKESVPDIITAGLPTVAVRMPSHPFVRALLENLQEPFVAPSANAFGKLSPTTAEHVRKSLGEKNVDLIVDLPGCNLGLESTILDITSEEIYLRRPGSILQKDLEQTLGMELKTLLSGEAQGVFPGEIKGHYAPDMKLQLVTFEELENLPHAVKINAGALTFRHSIQGFKHLEVLSPEGSSAEAATSLFASLHRLNQQNVSAIFAERLPEEGLGVAIMNRLRKAEATFK